MSYYSCDDVDKIIKDAIYSDTMSNGDKLAYIHDKISRLPIVFVGDVELDDINDWIPITPELLEDFKNGVNNPFIPEPWERYWCSYGKKEVVACKFHHKGYWVDDENEEFYAGFGYFDAYMPYYEPIPYGTVGESDEQVDTDN